MNLTFNIKSQSVALKFGKEYVHVYLCEDGKEIYQYSYKGLK